jgi:hypothetical protein
MGYVGLFSFVLIVVALTGLFAVTPSAVLGRLDPPCDDDSFPARNGGQSLGFVFTGVALDFSWLLDVV